MLGSPAKPLGSTWSPYSHHLTSWHRCQRRETSLQQWTRRGRTSWMLLQQTHRPYLPAVTVSGWRPSVRLMHSWTTFRKVQIPALLGPACPCQIEFLFSSVNLWTHVLYWTWNTTYSGATSTQVTKYTLRFGRQTLHPCSSLSLAPLCMCRCRVLSNGALCLFKPVRFSARLHLCCTDQACACMARATRPTPCRCRPGRVPRGQAHRIPALLLPV